MIDNVALNKGKNNKKSGNAIKIVKKLHHALPKVPIRCRIGQCHHIEPILKACLSLLSHAPKSADVLVSTWLCLESTVLVCAALTTIYNVKLLQGSCKTIFYEVGSEPISLALGNQRFKPISISSIHMYQEKKYLWLGL